jgi:hypothetical protein
MSKLIKNIVVWFFAFLMLVSSLGLGVLLHHCNTMNSSESKLTYATEQVPKNCCTQNCCNTNDLDDNQEVVLVKASSCCIVSIHYFVLNDVIVIKDKIETLNQYFLGIFDFENTPFLSCLKAFNSFKFKPDIPFKKVSTHILNCTYRC